MIQIILAILILLAIMGFSLIADMKFLGEYVDNPIIKIIVGPILFLLAGIIFIAVGALAILPWILLFTGHINWAILAFVIELILACFTEVQTTDGSLSNLPLPVKILIGLALFWIGGPIMLIVGVFLASPLLLLIWAL